MKLILATGEMQTSCLYEPLIRHGHEIAGIILPQALPRLSRRPRSLLFHLQYGSLASLIGRKQTPHRLEKDLKEGSLAPWIRQMAPDLLIVLSWPSRIPESFVDLFPCGALNIHPSILPALRGRDPIFSAILMDQPGFRVTFHRLTPELDSGPIFLQKPMHRGLGDHYDKLYFKFMKSAADLLPLAIENMVQSPDGFPQIGNVSQATPFRLKHTVYAAEDSPQQVVRKALACRYHHRMYAMCGKTLISFRKCTETFYKMGHIEKRPKLLSVRPTSLMVHHNRQVLKLTRVRIEGVPIVLSPVKMIQMLRKGQTFENEPQTLTAVKSLWRKDYEKESHPRHHQT